MWPIAAPLGFCSPSARDRYRGGECPTTRTLAERQAYPTRGTVGLAGCGLEYDLLASSPHAEGRAGGALPGDVWCVYEHHRDSYRVPWTLLRHWNRFPRYSVAKGTAHLCICLYLEHVLCEFFHLL